MEKSKAFEVKSNAPSGIAKNQRHYKPRIAKNPGISMQDSVLILNSVHEELEQFTFNFLNLQSWW
jgi:hypothetical protein